MATTRRDKYEEEEAQIPKTELVESDKKKVAERSTSKRDKQVISKVVTKFVWQITVTIMYILLSR